MQPGNQDTGIREHYVTGSPTRALVMHWFDEQLSQQNLRRARQLLEFMEPADREVAVKRLATEGSRPLPRIVLRPEEQVQTG
jgi:hypothetical protein